MTPEYKQLAQDRIKEIDALIRPLLDEQAKLRKLLLEDRSMFSVGDTITWQRGSKDRVGVVVNIKKWVCDQPCWDVRSVRKDGFPGSITTVYDWNKPTKL